MAAGILFHKTKARLARAVDFLGKSQKKNKSECAAKIVRLIKYEEANTEYGIGSRGSVRVGTGY